MKKVLLNIWILFVLLTGHLNAQQKDSFDGANFAGAIGSTLIIDDVEMVYEE